MDDAARISPPNAPERAVSPQRTTDRPGGTAMPASIPAGVGTAGTVRADGKPDGAYATTAADFTNCTR